MQIVIPMSGFGERFRRAGYTVPKPLIPVDGMPIIEHVVNMFPGDDNKFIFIVNEDHVKQYPVIEILNSIAPCCTIIQIPAQKLGPVYAGDQSF